MTAQTVRDGGTDSDCACPESSHREMLSLLDDSYTREILTCLQNGPKPARSVVTNCDCSRPTVYRRLARLEETGIVSTSVRYDPDGHHRKRFHLCVDKLIVKLNDSGVVVDTQRP